MYVSLAHTYIETERANVSSLIISGGDRELVDWLVEYVFPVEKKFQNDAYAKRVYDDVVDRSIASGVRDRVCAMHISAHNL